MSMRTTTFNDPISPLVTIVVHHRGTSHQLRECLEAIIAQDYPNIEIVLYDFGTRDGSWDCAVSYQRDYPGVITLLRVRCDSAFERHIPHFPNIRGRYFCLIDTAVALGQGAVSVVVSAFKSAIGCAYALLHSGCSQDERFYGCNCVISGIEQLRNQLIAVPFPGATLTMYDTDIAKVYNRYSPYANEANLCLSYSVISLAHPLFCWRGENSPAKLLAHFLSLAREKLQLLELVERLPGFCDDGRLQQLLWKRFVLELFRQIRSAIEVGDYSTALRYFGLAMSMDPKLVTQPWYESAFAALSTGQTSRFWKMEVAVLYPQEQFQQAPNTMVPLL